MKQKYNNDRISIDYGNDYVNDNTTAVTTAVLLPIIYLLE